MAKKTKSDFDRHRGPGRRLTEYAQANEDGSYGIEQTMMIMAIDEFKRANKLNFVKATDIVEIIRLLGYRKVRNSEVKLPCGDWRECSTTPNKVRTVRHEQRIKGTR